MGFTTDKIWLEVETYNKEFFNSKLPFTSFCLNQVVFVVILSQKMKIKYLSILVFLVMVTFSCEEKRESADSILINGVIYTVNGNQETVESVAIKDGKILAIGLTADILKHKGDSTDVIDLEGRAATPGLIESHAHIMGMGYNKMNVDLMDVKSYEELVQVIADAASKVPEGTWIVGRGWHQDKWNNLPEQMINGFPTHHQLSDAVPNHPVALKHASGHAALGNAKAMELAGVTKDTKSNEGGEVFKDISGNPTGIFNETAQEMLGAVMPQPDEAYNSKALQLAIDYALENGITSLHNAGADFEDIAVFKKFGAEGKLGIRLYTMLNGRNDSLLNTYYTSGPEIGLYNDFLTVRSIKLYADGALGSRGAWLIDEYTDAPGVFGHNVTPIEDLRQVINEGLVNGFQVCSHAIGDRANKEVLDLYKQAFDSMPEKAVDHRFRVEHAQHIGLDDIPRFAEMNVIAAVQAIHMSSDRPWAINRLGQKRIEDGAYVWQKLLESGAVVINGTDAPVEPVSAIASFYASVTRQTLAGKPEGGYESGQKMTRAQALKTYTLDAAYGAFEEKVKGSIEPGKYADFTVYSQDLMKVADDELLNTKIDMTIVDGKVKFQRTK
jgi:predicted amidohydrolase YtcJ